MGKSVGYTFCIAVVVVLWAMAAIADVPRLINYQGVLQDSGGDPVRNQTVDVEFRIYDASSGGNELWMEDRTVSTDRNGGFSIILGNVDPIPDSAFTEPDRWLGITVDTDPEMTPRAQLVSVPYSYEALRSDTTDFAESIADNTITSAKIQEGAILFSDIDQNGASSGQVMKWDVDHWGAANDEVGSASGWVDDGMVVRLETDSDSVGIGTTTPDEKLTVSGNAHVTGNLRVEGSITPSPIGWRHSGAQVFSGTAPSVWTDLDLSGYIGANYALVLIKVKGASGHATHIFRPNGDTDEYWRCSDLSDMGAQGHKGECAEAGVVVVETDGNGIVEWRGQGTNVTLTLLGYIR